MVKQNKSDDKGQISGDLVQILGVEGNQSWPWITKLRLPNSMGSGLCGNGKANRSDINTVVDALGN